MSYSHFLDIQTWGPRSVENLVKWDENNRLQSPAIIMKTPVTEDEWPIFRLCKEQGLEAIKDILPGTRMEVRASESSRFLYKQDGMPMQIPGKTYSWKATDDVIDVSQNEFVRNQYRSRFGTNEKNYYFTRSVDREWGAELFGDLNIFAVNASMQHPHPPPLFDPKIHVNIWSGTQGTFTPLHYDAYHNFFVCLAGRKRFKLLAPVRWNEAFLFPAMHPSARQSQKACSSLARHVRRRRIEVVLTPGQVLYIPPYWFHEVCNLTPSIGFNVWSDSVWQFLEKRVAIESLPRVVPPSKVCLDDWHKKAKMEMVYQIVTYVHSKAGGLLAALKSVLLNQYKPLLTENGNFASSNTSAYWWLGNSTEMADFTKVGRWEESDVMPDIDIELVAVQHAQQLVVILACIEHEVARLLAWGNVVQGMAHWAIKDDTEDVSGDIARFVYVLAVTN